MHKGKKHTESSYQPIKDKGGKVILTSKQARDVDEDFPSNDENSHEFDHKPSQTDVKQADFINSKMQKMRKESQGRKAVTDLNKALETIKGPQRKSALNMLGVSSPLDKKVSWKYGKGTYSGDLIPSMETSTHRYARTHNGKIKSLPKK